MKLLGGFDYSLKAMLLLMLIDIISGFVCAWLFNTSKYSKNGVSSNALMQGAARKMFMLAIVAIGVVLDRVLNLNYIRNATVMYFIATEGVSILENMVHMNVPVPKFIVNMLENLKEESDNANSNFDQERLLQSGRDNQAVGGNDSFDGRE